MDGKKNLILWSGSLVTWGTILCFDKTLIFKNWHNKHSLGLGTQTWHGTHKQMEYSIKHVENIYPSI